MASRLRLLALLVVVCLAGLNSARASDHMLKVMTQNMDAGTDLQWLFLLPLPLSVDQTYQEITAAHIPERAALLADEIALEQPDVISLQEVSLWRTGPSPSGAVNVLYDQLDLLLKALQARRVRYEAIAVIELTDAALPMSSGTFFRFTDRNAVLARSSLRRTKLAISNVEKHVFQLTFNFLGASIASGWISADVRVRGRDVRLVATHLQSTTGLSELVPIQVAQADELIQATAAAEMPVVLAGDFNSNAVPNGFENTDSVPHLLAAGYTDTWQAVHPGDPGMTWPLYLEDAMSTSTVTPYERIDLIFERGVDVLGAVRVGSTMPPFASDHLGVMTTVLLP